MKLFIKKINKKLIQKKLTISVVESCTGGLLSAALTSTNGSSNFFKLGLITYSNKSKIKILKVSKKIISKYGAVSNNCCKAMVENLNKISKTNISLSNTGIAGPTGGSRQKPVGLVYIGLKKGNKIIVNKCLIKNKGRTYIQKMAVLESLKLILFSLK